LKINPIYISTSSIKTKNVIEAVRQLSAITKNIELSGGCEYDESLLDKLIKIRRHEEINFLVHGYFPPPLKHFILNFADTDKNTRDFLEETMRFVGSLDTYYYSAHAGFKKNFISQRELLFESADKKNFTVDDISYNLEWFQENFPNCKIALENLYPNNSDKECCFMMHINEIISVLERFPEVYFLLDLGHLKISAHIFDFNYVKAAELLFENYSNRILGIHLSENNGYEDDHFLIYSDSIQPMILKEYADIIKNNKINITIESRNSSIQELSECLSLIIKAVS